MKIRKLEKQFRKWKLKYIDDYRSLSSKPDWKTVILTCMDTRIISEVFGVEEPGQAIILRNAGALLTKDSLRSILISIYKLEVERIVVVGHTNCGGRANRAQMEILLEKITTRQGITKEEALEILQVKSASEAFLGFKYERDQLDVTLKEIRNHPLIPEGIEVLGYMYNTKSGSLSKIN